jgi:hypothetical protein
MKDCSIGSSSLSVSITILASGISHLLALVTLAAALVNELRAFLSFEAVARASLISSSGYLFG